MRLIARLCCFLGLALLTPELSLAMGYPQDMFAEHVSAKPRAARSVRKPVTRKNTSTKAACPQRAAGPAQTSKKSPFCPQKAKTSPMVPAIRKLSVVVAKVFDFNTQEVVEKIVPMEAKQAGTYATRVLPRLLEQLFARLHRLW